MVSHILVEARVRRFHGCILYVQSRRTRSAESTNVRRSLLLQFHFNYNIQNLTKWINTTTLGTHHLSAILFGTLFVYYLSDGLFIYYFTCCVHNLPLRIPCLTNAPRLHRHINSKPNLSINPPPISVVSSFWRESHAFLSMAPPCGTVISWREFC